MQFRTMACIPARGGSKRVPRKNIRLFDGKPLIAHTIELALESKHIDRVFVTTEDEEIAYVAKKYGAEIIKRPKNLATDVTPSLPVFQHAIQYLETNNIFNPDIVVILQPTSPLRTLSDIEECITKLQQGKHDSVITVKKVDFPLHWVVRLDTQDMIHKLSATTIKNIKDFSPSYIPSGSVYVTWRDMIINHSTIRGPDTRALVIPEERSIDIDTEFDFHLAEQIKKGMFNEKNEN